MKAIKTFLSIGAVVLSVTAATSSAGAASDREAVAGAREFEGTVTSINRGAKTFRLRDSERGTVRIKVTARTRFERIDGFAGLKRGAKNIEATVKRRNGAWIALEVERSGGGGEHGGDDD